MFLTSAAVGTGVFGSTIVGSVSLPFVGGVIGDVGGTCTGLAVATAGVDESTTVAGGFALTTAVVGVVDAAVGCACVGGVGLAATR